MVRDITSTKSIGTSILVCISYICFCDNYAFGAVLTARYLEVIVSNNIISGEKPAKNPMIDSKIWCMLSCSVKTCYKLSWNSDAEECHFYNSYGSVISRDTNVIFYKKDVGNQYIYSKSQRMWYKIYITMSFPDQADTSCKKEGARVIHIDNLSRHSFLIEILRGETGMFLIDGSDPDNDQTWDHSDGTEMSFSYFNATNEPSDYGGDDCLGVLAEDGFSWHDMRCTFLLTGYVCEVPV